MKNIILTGFMGAGKSAVGKKLAERTGMTLVDTDEIIEGETGKSISEIFAESGERHFREIERKVVEKVSEMKNSVITTGGGVVLNRRNVKNLRKNGIIVYLHAEPEILYERLKKEKHRPLLRVENPLGRIKELMIMRSRFYADNDMFIDTSKLTVDEVADVIMKKVK
ncbi:MAG: shikimate kinase [Candidatus Hydrothermarchaeaceae archaeon]